MSNAEKTRNWAKQNIADIRKMIGSNLKQGLQIRKYNFVRLFRLVTVHKMECFFFYKLFVLVYVILLQLLPFQMVKLNKLICLQHLMPSLYFTLSSSCLTLV